MLVDGKEVSVQVQNLETAYKNSDIDRFEENCSAPKDVVAEVVSAAKVAEVGAFVATRGKYTGQTRGGFKPNGGPYDTNHFHFPADLFGPKNTYGENYVIFYINAQTDSQLSLRGIGGTNAQDYIPDGTNLGSSSGKKSGVETSGDMSGLGVAASSATAVIGSVFKGDMSGAKMNAVASTLLMSKSATNRATKRLKTAIALHMPNALSITYQAGWGQQDTADAQRSMLNTGGDATGGLTSAFQAKALNEAPIGKLISSMTGLAANPKKEQLFEGMDFRSFTFEYTFYARSPEELALAENIIEMFKFHMHPEMKKSSGNYLMIYPSEFDVVYYNRGNENAHIHRHTACVLTNMNVQHTKSGNFASFGGNDTHGASIEVSISLSFKELALLTKEEIVNGY